ncbi:NlpC/P60 family protein [Corynebacterium sp. 335C]
MGQTRHPRTVRRWLRAAAGLAVAGAIAAQAAPAVAQPADAPHAVTADEFARMQDELAGSDAVVQDLAARVAESRAAVNELELQLGVVREDVNRALVDLQVARAESDRAAAAADESGRRLEETRTRLRTAQDEFNELARAIARQGRSTSSVLGGADDAADALDRAGVLRREADKQQLILDDLVKARTRDANADARNRQAKAEADAATADAEARHADAETAIREVSERLVAAQEDYRRAAAAADILARQLEAARAAAAEAPEDQRNEAARGAAAQVAGEAESIDAGVATTQEYAGDASGSSGSGAAGDSDADVIGGESGDASGSSGNDGESGTGTGTDGERGTDASSTTDNPGIAGLGIDDILENGFGSSGGTADADGTGEAGDDASGSPARTATPGSPDGGSPTAGSREAKIETVINRAMGQLGVPYAWGGGDANGPTKGIRDGGVADRHGDYNKIGFDCSGLTLYAYAGVGIQLPHYTGYQYQKGTHYPKSQMQRGDLLFWGKNGHGHVALYLGDGQMIEAPQSGDVVKISKVRYDSMTPNVVRLL